MDYKLSMTNETVKYPIINESDNLELEEQWEREKYWEWVEEEEEEEEDEEDGEEDGPWNEPLRFITKVYDTIINENTPGYYTIMDGVPLIQIFFAKKERAKSKFSFTIHNLIYRFIDNDYPVDEDFLKNLCNLPERLLKDDPTSLTFSVCNEIARLFNYSLFFVSESIYDQIIDAYYDYKFKIIEALESMIYTHRWLEELAEQRNAEDFATDDASFQEKHPVCSYSNFEILDYIKGQRLFNNII